MLGQTHKFSFCILVHKDWSKYLLLSSICWAILIALGNVLSWYGKELKILRYSAKQYVVAIRQEHSHQLLISLRPITEIIGYRSGNLI